MKPNILLFFIVYIVAGCSSYSDTSTRYEYQAISALGDTLYAPELNPETESQFKIDLESAKAQYEANPDDAGAIIWYGRRTAYLGNYRKAVEIFTEGVKKHPEDARMYRYRGHRYITIRKFDRAIEDLEKAAELIKGTEDQIEPDGLPNTRNMPRSTLHTNIWYHLGLAHYLTGNFVKAIEAYRNCMNASTNEDMSVATSYWLYMTLKRAGNDGLAGEILEPIDQDMDLIENESYQKLLLVFKGSFDEKSLLDSARTSLENATIGYGLGNWHYVNGRTHRAEEVYHDVYQQGNWAAFGYIAAEVDLARLEF